MATGRIGVTPTLGTRWSKAPAGGTTSLSGLDDNSVSLVYSVGYEQVYRNGVLLSRGNDYTATTGNSITLIDATIAGDIIEVFANELVPLTDAISKGQFTAKGALLSATAASTPGVLAVGTNGQYLQADSTASTGLKWATLSAGGMTLLSTTTLSGSNTNVTSISQDYNYLHIEVSGVTNTTANGILWLGLNVTSTTDNNGVISYINAGTTVTSSAFLADALYQGYIAHTRTNSNNAHCTRIFNYTSTGRKIFTVQGIYVDTNGNNNGYMSGGGNTNGSAITSISCGITGGGTFSTGTMKIYGVK